MALLWLLVSPELFPETSSPAGKMETKAQLEPMSDGKANFHLPMMQNIKAGSWWDPSTLLLPAKYLLILREFPFF